MNATLQKAIVLYFLKNTYFPGKNETVQAGMSIVELRLRLRFSHLRQR